MGNTVVGAAIKMLTLVPFLVVIYYLDISRFSSLLASPHQLAILVVASSLLVLGAGLKWRILKVRLELSTISFLWGLVLLVMAAALYVYGSYSADVAWFHYESLYIFVLGYVAFRIGTGVLRSMTPLLAIFAFSCVPIPLLESFGGLPIVVLLFAEFLLFFLRYVGERLKVMAVPVGVVLLGLLSWLHPGFGLLGLRFNAVFLVPIPLLAIVLPGARRFTSLPRESSPTCVDHRVLKSGFCSVCGVKLSQAKVSENFSAWGLLAVAVVTLLLLFASVPVLAIVGGVPKEFRYDVQGSSGNLTPATPAGWQVNSTTVLSNRTQIYSIVRVYVPDFHPETKNYTMYYEVAVGEPLSTVPSGYIPGWIRHSSNSTSYGPFQGDLTSYVSPHGVMLLYEGKTTMSFLNGSAFEQYGVGVGFERQFKNANVTADTNQFFSDIQALWMPGFVSDASYSAWSSFLNGMESDLQIVSTFSLAAVSIAVMGWGAYRAILRDDRLDRFLTLAPGRSGKSWTYLSRLLQMPHRAGTAQELAVANGGASVAMEATTIDSSMRELERRHLVVTALVERGSDIISTWKAAV